MYFEAMFVNEYATTTTTLPPPRERTLDPYKTFIHNLFGQFTQLVSVF